MASETKSQSLTGMVTELSVVLPAYNEEPNVERVVRAVAPYLESLGLDYELLVVNDGSRDRTGPILDGLVAEFPRLRPLHHPQNRGYGGALRTGFASATKEWIFYTDGDAQYDPHELTALVGALRQGVDVVNGYKIARQDPLHRLIIGRLYHHIVKLAFGFKLRDVDCDFRLIRRSVFERFDLESTTGTICLEMVKKMQDSGAVFAEVPVHHYHRAYGKSQFFNFPRLWHTGVHLTQLWWKLVVRREHLRKTLVEPHPGESAPN
jgi:glycosyltransferase involved in cell wall biosynthesis